MPISKETEVKCLVTTALTNPDLNVALGALAHARLLKPKGTLESGNGFITTDPQIYYAQRHDKILDAFREGAESGKPPTISSVAAEFSCSLSTVHEIRKEWLAEQEDVA